MNVVSMADFSKIYFALQRWRKGPTAFYPGLPRWPRTSGGYCQGFGYLIQSESRTKTSGKASHEREKKPSITRVYYVPSSTFFTTLLHLFWLVFHPLIEPNHTGPMSFYQSFLAGLLASLCHQLECWWDFSRILKEGRVRIVMQVLTLLQRHILRLIFHILRRAAGPRGSFRSAGATL